jgi:CheY-like chemotaxis protein
VLSNLVNNAAKYTPGAGHVSLSTRREGHEAVVEVSDTGVGIAPEMIASIFDMFVQAAGASKTAQGGLGIGLTLAKSLVELHGGSVAARSAGIGKGATFTVRLPSKPNTALAPKPLRHSADAVVAAPFAALVVDDNRDAADGLSEMLESMGISVTVAYSGDAALKALETARPSLAILDLGMPGMDGCELARRIRGLPAHAGTVLVALTGWAQQRDKERTAAAGFDYHLAKPLDIDGLTPILRGMKVISD